MKFLLIFLLSCQFCFSQTKEETIDWLNRYLHEYYSEGWGEQYTVKVVNDDNYGELIVIDVLFKPLKTNRFYSFKPGAISRISTTRKLRSDKINGNLDLEFYSESKSIWTDKQELTGSFILSVQATDETVKRMQKGFIHLLELMGNEIESEKDFFKN